MRPAIQTCLCRSLRSNALDWADFRLRGGLAVWHAFGMCSWMCPWVCPCSWARPQAPGSRLISGHAKRLCVYTVVGSELFALRVYVNSTRR